MTCVCSLDWRLERRITVDRFLRLDAAASPRATALQSKNNRIKKVLVRRDNCRCSVNGMGRTIHCKIWTRKTGNENTFSLGTDTTQLY
ncbi:hypothetical protein ACLOJK_033438 [Asimina triloba]